MNSISITRMTAPRAAVGEITRKRLVDKIRNSQKRFTYIQAGAGYGKTTLLSQTANSEHRYVWLSLAGENDLFTFINNLSEAMRQSFPEYDFVVSEYMPFTASTDFITILANALISSAEKLHESITLILDDVHTIKNSQIKELFACYMKYIPDNIRIYMGSREAPWQELVNFFLRGSVLEFDQSELAFTRDEAAQILRFDDEKIYNLTEGWPLALNSFKVLLENGVSPADIPSRGNKALYTYLFLECINRLSPGTVDFLEASACFEELDASMLDEVLGIKDSGTILESLVSKNIFTVKTVSGHYRYHALFRESLLENEDIANSYSLRQKAFHFYWDTSNYTKAAEYAIGLNDKKLLQKCILANYRDLMKNGSYNDLRLWFDALGKEADTLEPEVLVAKGAFLSCTGNFTEAKKCLDKAIPQLKKEDWELYTYAMIHKARVLRNWVSFQASNDLLDKLIGELDGFAAETVYAAVIEKLYNLCWNSQINEAYALNCKMIEYCARSGDTKVMAWYERYLCAVCFFSGNMKDSVNYFEKSLELPEKELQYLDTHGVGIYAAKAYQMLGDRNRSLSVLSEELKKMRNNGKYEEMWSGYLFAAEIYFQNTSIDRANGLETTYEITAKYFTLADKYAPLYRKTDFQKQWAILQRLTYSLMFTSDPKKGIIEQIFANMDSASDYLKSIILARLFGYLAAVKDYTNTVVCAKLCIEIGEKSNMRLHSSLAYSMLARVAIASGNPEESLYYTQRCIRLCSENGIYEYFRARRDYDPILEFASENDIEPEFTKQLMEFAGYKTKKAYIKTFGAFAVLPYKDREKPVKMRTKKERELLAFLLDSGAQGATKEQICEAIWPDSESDNIKKLIGVNLAQIKKDFAVLGIGNPILCIEKRYSINRDEIECDAELFREAADKFMLHGGSEETRKLLSIYGGEYLSDFEAFWAIPKKIEYHEIHEKALKYLSRS